VSRRLAGTYRLHLQSRESADHERKVRQLAGRILRVTKLLTVQFREICCHIDLPWSTTGLRHRN
jgi:hypothetical protein